MSGVVRNPGDITSIRNREILRPRGPIAGRKYLARDGYGDVATTIIRSSRQLNTRRT